MSNKGFTLIEMCLVLMIISLVSLLPIQRFMISTIVKETIHDLISTQYKAIATHEKQYLDLPRFNQSVSYNAKGNITQAMRFEFHEEQLQLTLMLATGRIFMRRIEYD